MLIRTDPPWSSGTSVMEVMGPNSLSQSRVRSDTVGNGSAGVQDGRDTQERESPAIVNEVQVPLGTIGL